MITTVIPTFRRPLMLRRAIESAINQSYRNIKICVYDNASGDETEDVVKEFSLRDNRVFYYKNEKNIGAINNMIRGVREVTTPYYSLLNDDDFLLPDFYEKAMMAFSEYPSAGFVCVKTVTLDLINKRIELRNKDWLPGYYEPSNAVTSQMYFSHIVQTGVLLSKKMESLIGAFDLSGNDHLYMTMAAAAAPFVILDHYGAAYISHELAYSAIDEGISKERIPTLYESLLISVKNVIEMDLPSDEKMHLLMFVMRSYQEMFDSKKLRYLFGTYSEEKMPDLLKLPSLITNRGFVAKLYCWMPRKLNFFIKYLYKIIVSVRAIKRSTASNWSPLRNETHEMLINCDIDISKLTKSLGIQ